MVNPGVHAALKALALVAVAAGCEARPPAQAGETQAAAVVENLKPDIPAGVYRLDPSHASLVFRVDHVGFSFYTGQFAEFDATMDIDPARPEAARLNASVNVASLIIPRPPEGFLGELLGGGWFNAEQFPQIAFRSTSIERTGDRTARVSGELTFRGVTQPASFAATFNGGYAGLAEFDPNARIGFVAEGSLKRSGFGMSIGLPPAGSSMGVGDEVSFRVDAEFTGPPMMRAEPYGE